MWESRDGRIVIYNGSGHDKRYFNYFNGRKFVRVNHRIGGGFGYSREQAILQDREGDWWIATDQGVHRYSGLSSPAGFETARPKAIYDQQGGLARNYVDRIIEDRRGDIWIVTGIDPKSLVYLHRWERITGKIHQYHLAEEVAPSTNLRAIGEDAEGSIWLANHGATGMARYRDGQFRRYTIADGAPASAINAFFTDSKKRFWIATRSKGLFRLDDTASGRLRMTTWDVARGLASNEVWSITEDRWGRIYAGTGRGIDRLDPESGYIRHFSSADGLAKGEVLVSLRDRNDHLWFVTEQGVSRMAPSLDRPNLSLPVLIMAIRVDGHPIPVSELGQAMIDGLEFNPDQRSLRIDFTSLDFSTVKKLRYQYRLNEEAWSQSSELGTVNFSSLSPGYYKFAARAISTSGVVSDRPATITFMIKRPVWQRLWFLSFVLISLGALVYAAYRYRLAQAVRIERVRTRIAHDLHDDIGASLTRISILSEVAKQQRFNDSPSQKELLDSIAEISRESVAAMNDIVWAINPEHDSLSDLASRMRRHAVEIFLSRNIDLDFQVEGDTDHLKLDIETRRDLYLFFKEALNNAARHADCLAVRIRLHAGLERIQLIVSDDGKGFDPGALIAGNGLHSMRDRALAMGGELTIESELEKGTCLNLTVPLGARRFHRNRGPA